MPYRPLPAVEPPEDAVTLLTNDHAEIAELFGRYRVLAEAGAAAAERRNLAEEICTFLLVHAAIEDELFYPAARRVLDDAAALDDALVEHASAAALVAQIQGGDPEDPRYDACVRVLGEYVAHHVREEEDGLFPLVRASALDLDDLGERLGERQEALLSADGRVDVDG